MPQKNCMICRKQFQARVDRIVCCSTKCSRERNRGASNARAERIRKENIDQPKVRWIANPDEKDLEPPSIEEREIMWENVLRIFFPLDAQVSMAFSEAQGLRGVGASAMRVNNTNETQIKEFSPHFS